MIIKSTPEDSVLYAFYDLAVNPNSFDFSKFLVLAELYRKEGKFTEIHIIITPDKDGWARSDDPHDSDQQEWRLRNILMPILSLIPSIKSHTIFSSRSQATKFELDLGLTKYWYIVYKFNLHFFCEKKKVQLFVAL